MDNELAPLRGVRANSYGHVCQTHSKHIYSTVWAKSSKGPKIPFSYAVYVTPILFKGLILKDSLRAVDLLHCDAFDVGMGKLRKTRASTNGLNFVLILRCIHESNILTK